MSRTTQHAHHSHDFDGDLAVFLIGMRINKPWRPDIWVPTLRAMGPMLAELHRARAAAEAGAGVHPGFLDHRTLLGAGGPTLVQYWRSVEDIYAYAHDPGRGHRPAWLDFYRRSREAAGVVGIWHETYAVPAGAHESLYVSMPATGLGAAFGTTSDRSGRRHARLARAS
ncbi:hypothetical protein N865_13810 [Intrasporangium oryzae NRRL B-24470]|uniref:Uncharacterized protein n=1 Tax=Intrasporangium oryzae NRRL B-24470 TaxID=1386089 RepID=W9G3Y0_9MICO|nr:DUF4188 domain-containing protein [Intrasporangium oryzae]EWT00725.1 hypothetical protein N865_13810 [Intrasporangium oryzae NRRL B-24470]